MFSGVAVFFVWCMFPFLASNARVKNCAYLGSKSGNLTRDPTATCGHNEGVIFDAGDIHEAHGKSVHLGAFDEVIWFCRAGLSKVTISYLMFCRPSH